MNETMKISKTGKSKFGYYVMEDTGGEKPNFKSVTEQVSNFLSKQVPCTIEIEETGEKGIITRVKVSNTQPNSMEQPVEVVKPFEQATNYKPSNTPYTERISDQERQNSIINQSCIKAALRMIELHNQISENKVEPTRANVFNNAQIAKLVYEDLSKEPELPDY